VSSPSLTVFRLTDTFRGWGAGYCILRIQSVVKGEEKGGKKVNRCGERSSSPLHSGDAFQSQRLSVSDRQNHGHSGEGINT